MNRPLAASHPRLRGAPGRYLLKIAIFEGLNHLQKGQMRALDSAKHSIPPATWDCGSRTLTPFGLFMLAFAPARSVVSQSSQVAENKRKRRYFRGLPMNSVFKPRSVRPRGIYLSSIFLKFSISRKHWYTVPPNTLGPVAKPRRLEPLNLRLRNVI